VDGELAPEDLTHNFNSMTGLEVIKEIKRLPKDEQTKVIEFARQMPENRPLAPEELGELARRMVETKDSAEADRLQEKIVRGFYGGESHAQFPQKPHLARELLEDFKQRAGHSPLSDEDLDRLTEIQRNPRRGPSHWDER
jgi:hypothetical protein